MRECGCKSNASFCKCKSFVLLPAKKVGGEKSVFKCLIYNILQCDYCLAGNIDAIDSKTLAAFSTSSFVWLADRLIISRHWSLAMCGEVSAVTSTPFFANVSAIVSEQSLSPVITAKRDVCVGGISSPKQ